MAAASSSSAQGGGNIVASTLLDNRGGAIASNGDTTISAGALSNQGGVLQAAGAAGLNLAVDGILDNSAGGRIATGASATINAGSILNGLGQISAGGRLTANAAQGFQNSQGLLAANGDVRLTASTLDNTGGKIASVAGTVSATSVGATANDGGVIQADGDMALRNGGLSNTQAGAIIGRNIAIDTSGQTLNNQQGTIAATQSLDLRSGPLLNDAGLIQSGGSLAVDTGGQALGNTNAVGYALMHPYSVGGIVSAGPVTLRVGDWYNAGGFFGAGGSLSGSTGSIDNTSGGQIVGQSSVNLAIAGLGNQGGQVQTLGDIMLNAGGGAIDNNTGLIRSGGTLSLTGSAIYNRATQGVGQGIEGRNIVLTTPYLLNDYGAIRADGDATVNSSSYGSVINTNGLVSAGGTLTLQDTGASRTVFINNGYGTLIGGRNTNIRASNLSGDGKVLSLGDMTLDLGSYFHYNGEITANNNASILLQGDLTNYGKLRAGGTLNISARNIDNTASGEISAGSTRVNASGTLSNRGVIDGVNTEVDAVTLDNIGTGRLYGDHLSIQANQLGNSVEAGVAASIAARDRLDIGTNTLNNTEHALIFSAGDMAIGGALSANRFAVGRAGTVTNASATIEALGSLSLSANQVDNLNNHFSTEMGPVSAPKTVTEYQGQGSATRYLADTPGVNTYVDESLHLRTPEGTYESWTQYDITRTTRQTAITHTDPGRIVAGGSLVIDASGVFNKDSQILAGGLLSVDLGALRNVETPGEKITSESGWATSMWRDHRKGIDTTGSSSAYYFPPDLIESISMNSGRVEEYTAAGGSSSTPGAPSTGSVSATTSAAGAAGAVVNQSAVISVVEGVQAVNAAVGQQAGAAQGGTGATGSSRGETIQAAVMQAATGAQADVAVRNNDAGSADALQVNFAANSVGERAVAAASGMGGAQGSERIVAADVTGAGGANGGGTIQDATAQAVTGTQAHTAVGNVDTGSADVLQVSVATSSVGERVVAAASGVGGAQGSERIAAAPAEQGGVWLGAAVAKAAGRGGPERASLSVSDGGVGTVRTTGGVALAATDAAQPSNARVSPVQQVELSHPSNSAQVVRTGAPSIQLPNASIHQFNPGSSSHYLIETDPRFTNQRQWMGSDYMMSQLQFDPEVTQKRLGDGYYEQRLMRAQVAQLTGQRFLGDHTNDDDEYRSLMDAGVAYAKSWNLRPGVALTPAQMAALTADIVWLVQQEVTLANGSVEKVLVPQVYARIREGDLTGGGALLAGKDVDIRVGGDLVNSGSIGGRNVVNVAADNVQNVGGRIHGDAVSMSAKTDLNNVGGTISANSELIALAGRDFNIETSTRSASSAGGGNSFGRTTIDRVGGLYVTGDGSAGSGSLVASAGRDLNLLAGQIGNAGKDSVTLLQAGNNLNLGTVTTASNNSLNWDANNYRKDSASTEVGSQVHASGAIVLKTDADINARAANVQTGTSVAAIAGNNINVVAGVNAVTVDEGHQHTAKSFLHKELITTRDTLDRTSALASNLGGASVSLVAGNDLKVTGSAIAGDAAVDLTAGNAIVITAATDTSKEAHARTVKESGFLSGGGFGISYGTRTTRTDQQQDASLQSGQARSLVGSVGGNLTLNAGAAINIAGSDLTAGKDISVVGKSVMITPGQDKIDSQFTSRMTQDGFILAVGGSVVNAIQATQAMRSAAGQTSTGRLKALAAASAAMTVKDAAQDFASNGPSAKISLTVGHSETESTELTSFSIHGGSGLAAGNNVTIGASGGGKASNIDVVGSEVRAKGDVLLTADNQVNLLAAQDTESQHSQSKSWSAAIGVAAEISKDGAKYGLTASASASRDNVGGEGATQVHTHVSAGDRLTIASGGDANLKGAVVSGGQVVADIKGNLNIESVQDTATLDGKRQSASGSGTFGAGAGFSASLSESKVHNDYASVQEQSGIRAGDGGFQVLVVGKTDLKGGVISGSEQSIKDGRNSLVTSVLAFSDIQNRDSTDSSGVSLGANVGKNQSGDTFSPSMAPGIGQVRGSQVSVTRSGVSGAELTIAGQQAVQEVVNLNRDVSTGKDMAQVLTKCWTGAQALDQVGAQMQIASAALPRLAKEIGDYAAGKVAELNQQGKADEAAKWAEGGIYRVAAHAALGAMGGGIDGAIGAAATAEAAPTLGRLQDALQDKLANAGLNNDAASLTAKLIAGGASAAIGGVVGGGAGAATGLNADVNNRQLHPDEKIRIKQLAGGDAREETRLTAAACALVKCYGEYPEGSAAYQQLKQLADFGASDAFAEERARLSKQPDMFGYSATGIFSDANIDAAKKLNNTYQIGTRLVGTAKLGLGVAGVAVSAITAPVSCATGIGCFANAAAATISFDAGYSGAKQLISGDPTETYLNQGLQSLGMSPKAAGWVEAGLGIGSAATAFSVANKAVDQTIAFGKLNAATYHDFSPNGLVPTLDVMSASQTKLMMKEIQGGSPGLSDTMVRNITQEILQSGTALPRVDVASANTMLIKVVPKGSGVSDFSPYWMTVDQAKIIANSSAEQAAQILGLPAAPAGKMLKEGMDFFAIAPKPGLQPTVFLSDIAATTQGAYTTAPSARQIIVPNRSLWTPATPINPLTIK